MRKAAQTLGWETLRLDGNQVPDWFDPPDQQFAFFYTAPHAFEIARQLGRVLVGCNPDWTVQLPKELLRRELIQTTLEDAWLIGESRFVKHSVSKAFPAGVYNALTLKEATGDIHPNSLVHVGEPVEWESEFRCFVANGKVMTVSPYVFEGVIVADYQSFPNVSEYQMQQVLDFAESVLARSDVVYPPAFVMDVGIIRERGWAVVECNECWASGIYACDPVRVLETLLAANVEHGQSDCGESVCADDQLEPWNFERHYAQACHRVD